MTQALAYNFAPPALTPLPSLLVPVMQALKKRDTYLALNKGLPKAVVVEREGKDANQLMSVDRERVDELLGWGYVTEIRGGALALYAATDVGASMTPDECPTDGAFRKVEDIQPQKENPVRILARKKGPDGKPFLGAEHVRSADFLAEDFAIAGFAVHPVGSLRELVDFVYPSDAHQSILDAHRRLVDALETLGPDLGDIALRCCCLGEGVETAERRMGWSARSGKIVLRIALRRLVAHYDQSGAEYCA